MNHSFYNQTRNAVNVTFSVEKSVKFMLKLLEVVYIKDKSKKLIHQNKISTLLFTRSSYRKNSLRISLCKQLKTFLVRNVYTMTNGLIKINRRPFISCYRVGSNKITSLAITRACRVQNSTCQNFCILPARLTISDKS